jgi:hypothetical protein
VDGRFVRTKVAAQRCLCTGTFQAECRGERIDGRAKQSPQSFQALGRFWLPDRDEIAAGPELAERLALSFSIWYHLYFPGCVAGFKPAIRGRDALDTILQIRSVANVLSAGRVNLPKQKPNKNVLLQDFFFAFTFLF